MADVKASGTKARSPQYPVIGLGEAIAKVRTVYAKDYQNRIPKGVVARHMGFNALHGKSLGVLAALTRYGLLEGRGGDCRVSDRAMAIIAHPPGSKERVEAIQAAATSPAIFQELDGKFPDGRGSDDGMRAYLMTNKFIPDAAETAIRSYRETKKVVAAESGGYDSASVAAAAEGGEAVSSNGADKTPPLPRDPPLRNPPPPKPKGLMLMDGERELTTGLLSKDASFRLIVNGPIGEREIDMLIKKLQLDKAILADEPKEPADE
jgi:hypothetical protein